MKNQSFNFEIKDLITQFLAAFDDVVIKRYDSNRQEKETVEVRYVLAPKERVMYDIVNKAQNLTLPVVAVNITGISRDEGRVFNKINSLYNSFSNLNNTTTKMPVPVNIQVNMSILARYMQDMDQIISNFVVYNNPYIIISWKEPTSISGQTVEIRSEVLWDGNITLTSPTETTYSDKFRIIADTSFTIKGWLFRSKNNLSAPIFTIDNNFIPVRTFDSTSLDELREQSETETVSISGFPLIDSIFYSTGNSNFQLLQPIKINTSQTNTYLLYGKNFIPSSFPLLSTNSNLALTTTLTTISSSKFGTATGYLMLSSDYSILNENLITLTPPLTNLSGNYKIDFVIANETGFTSITAITS